MRRLANTVTGLVPVFLSEGRGSDVMQPMAIPSVGGTAVSLITRFPLIVPCIHSWVEEARVRRRLSSGARPASSVEAQA